MALLKSCGFDIEGSLLTRHLSTPNVQGFAYMLMQHKVELGNLFIERIQVFQGETKAELPCILVHASQPREQTGGGDQIDEGKHVLTEYMLRARL
jgi:hypothetical protein